MDEARTPSRWERWAWLWRPNFRLAWRAFKFGMLCLFLAFCAWVALLIVQAAQH